MKIFYIGLLLILGITLRAQKTDIANYKIQAELFPESKTIKAYQTITWTNTSNKAVTNLQFHLYLNAFKNKNSTFFKEQQRNKRFESEKVPSVAELGGIQVRKLSIENNQNLRFIFIQPDDLNQSDETVIQVNLPKAIKTGQSIKIQIEFDAKLPKMVARTGWDKNDFFFVAQWFPKIGVLDKNGVWNCHQFHEHTEFFADFGSYDIQLTVPQIFKLAGTGILKSTFPLKNNKTQYHFKVEKVHDFAWVVSPDFIIHSENYKGIAINTFLMPEHACLQKRYSVSIKQAIDYMQAHVGAYPHPSINLIDPPIYASESNGMEYPMLIGCGSTLGLGSNIRMQEVVTIHEFIHQYFQGLLASNEFENSWMDEGFTQYYEGRVMAEYYKGSQVSILGFELNDLQSSREGYVSMKYPEIAALRTNAWQYPVGSYGILSYQKTATFLKTLENYLGKKQMDKTIAYYFEKYKFTHPEPEDFINAVKEANPNINSQLFEFVNNAIFTSKSMDYSIESIKGKVLKIKKNGDLKLPMNVMINYTDGTFETISLNENLILNLPKTISSAYIDPYHKNWMDLNWTNNSKSAENQNQSFSLKFGSKWLFWLQNIWS
jgi:Peptidase family M1 domain